MRLRTWKTADVPAADRFDAWSEALSSTHLDWELVGTEPDFEAKVVERTVGDLRLIGCRCDPCEGFRSPRHVNRGDGDYIGILFELSGLEIVRQGDREATLRPGDFVIWDNQATWKLRGGRLSRPARVSQSHRRLTPRRAGIGAGTSLVARA